MGRKEGGELGKEGRDGSEDKEGRGEGEVGGEGKGKGRDPTKLREKLTPLATYISTLKT